MAVKLALLALLLPSPLPADLPEAVAERVSDPIRLDGLLDEPAWQRARPLGPLTQREPLEGAPASERTEVRVLFDRDFLYFGVICYDRQPEAIVATQMGRDSDLDVDDKIVIVLDPFFDQRNGFFFEVNPAGARSDGQISNNAEHPSREWDGIWDARCRLVPQGWAAEIAIPFKTLRFKPDTATWGLNIERTIKRRNENNRWASARQDIWLTNLSEAGRLRGLDGIRQGRGLDVRPYVLAGSESGDREAEVGLDVFKSLGPSLNASLSLNTDFAETEVDARQVNLTRFPLFFPEKRAFFLEGSGVFEVAGLSGPSRTDLIPFFSRRIGLREGEEVPIVFGAKLVGRAKGYNLGLVDVRTDDQPSLGLEPENLFVARLSRNVLQQSWVGALVTHGDPGGGSNHLVGVDARLATSTFRGDKNLSLDLYYLRTDPGQGGRADRAFGFVADYPNDRWDVVLRWVEIGEAFEPALGFVPRQGIRKANLGVSFRPRPARWGIRQFFFEFRPEYVSDLGNRVLNWRLFTAPINFRTESGDSLEWNYVPEYEFLGAPFEIRPEVVIPPGSYRWSRYQVEFESASKRSWVVDATVGWGSFYDGHRLQTEIGLVWKPSARLLLEGGLERNQVSLPAGEFTTRILQGRADYNFSPDISWQNLVQYDSESRILGVQSRFRWILKPGNDLFLVLNRGWESSLDRLRPSFDRESVKLQYTFRF